MVSGSWDSSIRLWKLFEKRQEAVFKEYASEISTLAITNNNQFIVSGYNDRTVKVWNLFEKRQEAVFQGHTDTVSSVVITKDNQMIVSGSDRYHLNLQTIL